DEHCLEAAQNPIASPILRELDGGSLEIATVLLQLRLESREKRERIGGGAGKAGENPVVVQTADLARGLLHDGLAEGDLAVAGEDRPVLVPDRQNRRAVQHGVKPRGGVQTQL